MMNREDKPCDGGCACGHVRYRVLSDPLIVHCCHCRDCQRQTGSAFVVNALIESDRVVLLQGEVVERVAATPSGRGQTIARCPECQVAVWSNYHMSGLARHIRFIRAGTLDEPERMPPDVHIFTTSKQPWVPLPEGAHAVDIFYDYARTWSPDSLDRRAALFELAGLPAH